MLEAASTQLVATDLPVPEHILARQILAATALKHDVSVADLLSERRDRALVNARHELAYELRRQTSWSSPRIGRFMDRDQTSIRHSILGHCRRNDLPYPQGKQETPSFPKLIVLGHGRHGKDTVCDIICEKYDVTFVSSSLFVADRAVRPALEKVGITYPTLEACYDDRHNHRQAWYEAIRDFNRPDAARLGRALFAEHNIYCGLRNAAEFYAMRNTNVFDFAVWVDASRRLPPEDKTSISVEQWMADYTIDNNGTLDELKFNVEQFCIHQINPRFGLDNEKAA